MFLLCFCLLKKQNKTKNNISPTPLPPSLPHPHPPKPHHPATNHWDKTIHPPILIIILYSISRAWRQGQSILDYTGSVINISVFLVPRKSCRQLFIHHISSYIILLLLSPILFAAASLLFLKLQYCFLPLPFVLP